MIRLATSVLSCALLLAPGATAQQKPLPAIETTVGMRARIDELPLPGSQLRAKPVRDPQKAKLIVRVLNVYRHGTAFRYNFEVTPLVAGHLDLREHLEREDGSSTADLPEIPIEVRAVLPEDRLEPNQLAPAGVERVGGYRTWQIVIGVLWIIGLLLILFWRRTRADATAEEEAERPRTLADRLRPLVEGARAGTLDTGRRAELERLLLDYWRRRRSLEGEKIGAAIATLRKDPEASPLFLKLEQWLHQPEAEHEDVDAEVASLLEPYRNVPELDRERESA